MAKNKRIDAELIKQVKRHEGFRTKMYLDGAGRWTIGYGHNLEANGIPENVAALLLFEDLNNAKNDLNRNHPWAFDLSKPRYNALINMVFNLGISRFNEFKRMIAAFKEHDYEAAAREALDSRWARQVGNRAVELAEQIRKG